MQTYGKDFQKIMKHELFVDCDKERVLTIFEECDCKVCLFDDGAILRSPNESEKRVGMILSGKATATTPNPTKNTLLRFFGAGEMFGIANLFSEDPFVSIIRARGSCRVFMLPEKAIRRLLEEESTFLYHYLEFLSGRIRFLNRKIGYLTAGSAERRLALYLYSIGKTSFHLDISISSLSELLDIGRASLYRAFDRLCDDGFLQKNGRSFTLINPQEMLQAYR